MGRDSAHGSGHEALKTSRVEWGRVRRCMESHGTGRVMKSHGKGLDGSGREFRFCSRVGAGYPDSI